MLRKKNKSKTGIYMKMVCNSMLIYQSTHDKAIFTFLKFECFLLPCMGESIERWLWIHTVLIVIRKSLDCRTQCQTSLFRMCLLLFLYLFVSSQSLYLIHTHLHTYIHTHAHTSTLMRLHHIRHRWYNLAWWVWSGVHVCWCSVPESWSSLEGPDSGQLVVHFAAPPSSTTHAETLFSCPYCAVCRSLG